MINWKFKKWKRDLKESYNHRKNQKKYKLYQKSINGESPKEKPKKKKKKKTESELTLFAPTFALLAFILIPGGLLGATTWGIWYASVNYGGHSPVQNLLNQVDQVNKLSKEDTPENINKLKKIINFDHLTTKQQEVAQELINSRHNPQVFQNWISMYLTLKNRSELLKHASPKYKRVRVDYQPSIFDPNYDPLINRTGYLTIPEESKNPWDSLSIPQKLKISYKQEELKEDFLFLRNFFDFGGAIIFYYTDKTLFRVPPWQELEKVYKFLMNLSSSLELGGN